MIEIKATAKKKVRQNTGEDCEDLRPNRCISNEI